MANHLWGLAEVTFDHHVLTVGDTVAIATQRCEYCEMAAVTKRTAGREGSHVYWVRKGSDEPLYRDPGCMRQSRRMLPQHKIDLIAKMAADGIPIRQIAVAADVSRNTVRAHMVPRPLPQLRAPAPDAAPDSEPPSTMPSVAPPHPIKEAVRQMKRAASYQAPASLAPTPPPKEELCKICCGLSHRRPPGGVCPNPKCGKKYEPEKVDRPSVVGSSGGTALDGGE